MARYTKKDKDGRYYIESANGKLESNIKGHTYGEAIDRFAELENADVVPRSTIDEIFALIWDAFQSTYYDSEFEEKFDEIEKKYTEGKT